VVCEVFDEAVFNNFVSNRFQIKERQSFKTRFEPLQVFLLVPKSSANPPTVPSTTENSSPNS